MEITKKFNKLESITYRFSEAEVREALIKAHSIQRGTGCEFYLCEGYEDEPAFAELTVIFKTKLEGDPE